MKSRIAWWYDQLRHGELVHPVHGTVQVAWVRPFRTPDVLRPDLHLAVEYASGALPDTAQATSGGFSAGATLGFDIGPAWIGPGVDLRVPFRQNQAGDLQYGVTPAGLASAGIGVPLGRSLALELRADASVATEPTLAATDPLVYGVAVRAGLRLRP